MPIANVRDAVEVEERLYDILDEDDAEIRVGHIRTLFVETLDWQYADGLIPLHNARNEDLPSDAHLIASRDGTSAVYIPLTDAETDRVTAAAANAVARALDDTLSGDLLLLFTNQAGDQFHIVRPDLTHARPRLQRMVARRGEHHRTVVQQLANMWDDYGRNGQSVHQSIVSAFSVEPVTELFFNEYRRIFGNAKNEISGFTDERELHLFTQTLFNRLMFVYFISRKGWLKLNGDTDYVNALWHAYRSDGSQSNFYITRLQPFFFSGLNNPQAHDLSKNDPVLYALIGDVEFLNGGLFEKGRLDRRENVIVPDEVIEPILTDLFDRFNFTVTESTPYDTEVAVDPEMLGKVFEELVNERHESGAYYTPRPVVSFMCREALKGYLEGQNTGLTESATASFVDTQETQGISVADARRVAGALERVTVVDPACGSGAYLLGMMQELVDLQTTLFNAGADSKSIYDLKLEIIRRNLYGADIDDFAVNIAMLRLWLSLVIEYEGDKPEALPNLDFKIACGDSLLAPDPDPQKYGDFTAHLMRESDVAELKAEYMRARTQGDKDRLRDKISEAQEQIEDTIGDAARAEGAIDWRVEFAEVMGSGGFDIVVANPPYVRQERIDNKSTLVALYRDAVIPRSDLYCHFYARALQLLRDNGMHIFVCSNSWLDVGYGAKLQEHLLKTSCVEAIYESAVERQFSTAQINTLVSVIRKGVADDNHETRFVSLRDEFERSITNADLRREITLSRAQLMEAGLGSADSRGRSKYVGDKWGGKYLRAPDIYHHILDKCDDKLVRLGDIATIRFGIKTGANAFFYLDREDIARWGIEEDYLRLVMTSPRESRSITVDIDALPKRLFMCHKDKDELSGTGALEYIEWGEAKEYHSRSSVRSRQRWYDLGLRDTTALAMNYLIGTTARTFFTNGGLRFGDNFQQIHSDTTPTLQLCATMNATLSQLLFNISGRANFGGGLMKIQTFEMENLTVLNPSLLPEIPEEMFTSTNWDVLTPSAERRQIDAAVFDALELTQGEQDAVYEGVTELVGNRLRRARSV